VSFNAGGHALPRCFTGNQPCRFMGNQLGVPLSPCRLRRSLRHLPDHQRSPAMTLPGLVHTRTGCSLDRRCFTGNVGLNASDASGGTRRRPGAGARDPPFEPSVRDGRRGDGEGESGRRRAGPSLGLGRPREPGDIPQFPGRWRLRPRSKAERLRHRRDARRRRRLSPRPWVPRAIGACLARERRRVRQGRLPSVIRRLAHRQPGDVCRRDPPLQEAQTLRVHHPALRRRRRRLPVAEVHAPRGRGGGGIRPRFT